RRPAAAAGSAKCGSRRRSSGSAVSWSGPPKATCATAFAAAPCGSIAGWWDIRRRRNQVAASPPPESPQADASVASAAQWVVYVLVSADRRRTYVGITLDLERRLAQH